MSHLYLPTEHNDTDLALASAVAEAIDSNQLFVAWTWDRGTVTAPEGQALLGHPEPALRNPFAEALIEIVAAVHALVSLVFRRRQADPAGTNQTVRASRSQLEGDRLGS
jgi:hypothetical protein